MIGWVTSPERVVPEWGWGAITIILVALISVIAYMLRRRDREISVVLERLTSKTGDHATQISRLWDRAKVLATAVKSAVKDPTLPTATEESLRQLQHFRVSTGAALDQLRKEAGAVEKKHADRLMEADHKLTEIQERLWVQVNECSNTFVNRKDYRERVRRSEILMSDLQKIATQLEERVSALKNKKAKQ